MADSYTIIKTIHISTVICTISLFLLRAIWIIRTSKLPAARWLKILPHINDSLLLTSAVAMLYLADIRPDSDHLWLVAKIIAMVLYILCGLYLFKYTRTRFSRISLSLIAVLLLSYILHTAITKSLFF